jgi:hypothetical protein
MTMKQQTAFPASALIRTLCAMCLGSWSVDYASRLNLSGQS